MENAARDAIGNGGRWVGFNVSEESVEERGQIHRRRPSQFREYRIIARKRFHVEWKPHEENIDFDEACDGIFPLITSDLDMPLRQVLSMYKYQPHVEKRHEQLKSVYGVAPVMLKNIGKIEAFLFVYFIALLVESLIEREIRNNMVREDKKSIRIYPEFRSCQSPTTDWVLGGFSLVQISWIESGGKILKAFLPKLTRRQEELLRLAGVPISEYQKDRNVIPLG